ncbi:MAG TPA: transcription elongation factor GreA [Caulobacteraceae bacterium]|jgi:transcription elongation GreA/GreB family factor
MSVAFTKETDVEAHAADLPDRPISPHPNLVTTEGLAALDAELEKARADYTAARTGENLQADRTALARAVRDLRYWQVRRASAQLTDRDPSKPGVQFGDRVGIEREDGRRQSFRIVGEDEADPKAGSVSWVSPLAQALLGKTVGDVAMVAGAEVELVSLN